MPTESSAALREALAALKPYADHAHDCGDHGEDERDNECSCGYDAANEAARAALAASPGMPPGTFDARAEAPTTASSLAYALLAGAFKKADGTVWFPGLDGDGFSTFCDRLVAYVAAAEAARATIDEMRKLAEEGFSEAEDASSWWGAGGREKFMAKWRAFTAGKESTR